MIYTAAITAYQRVLDFGPDIPVAEDAARNLQVVIEAMNAHFAPGGPVAAAQYCLTLVRRGKMRQLWEELEPNLRLVLAQAWIFSNRDHPRLAGLNRDELASELAKPRPRHRLTRDFFATQLDEFRHAYSAYDEDTWGAAERPRRFGIDYELVILMETGGDGIDWQPDMGRPAFPFYSDVSSADGVLRTSDQSFRYLGGLQPLDLFHWKVWNLLLETGDSRTRMRDLRKASKL